MSRGGLLRWSRRCRLLSRRRCGGAGQPWSSRYAHRHSRIAVSPVCAAPGPRRDFSPDFYQLLQASGMDAVVRHTEAGGTFTHFTCESSPRKAPPRSWESDAVRRQRSQPVRRRRRGDPGWIADAPLPPRDKAPVDYFWSRRASSSAREFTLNLAADVENFTALPAGYEIARRAEKRWVVQARAPISSFPTPGSPPASARAVAPRRCPSSPATSLRKHHD